MFRSFVVAVSTLMGSASVGAADCGKLLDYNVRTLADDREVNLCEAYSGRVLLVVNTASKCAFTGQYEGLEKLYSEYQDRGLVVLGFPSNDFGEQEPGSEKQISNFCRTTYGVEFPMFSKTKVKGRDADPFWQALVQQSGTSPKWNFYKYLINREGEVVDVFSSITSPDSGRFRRAIERLLQVTEKDS